MCGIIGVIGKTAKQLINIHFDVFTNMLVTDAVRGRDSTGVFGIDHNRNADIIKIASHPFNLLSTKEWETFRGKAWSTGQVLIGHNRKATEGAIKNINAHPFTSGPIVLVHNGHITNFKSLVPIKTRTNHNIEVDSHGIAYLLATNEPVKVFKDIRGAYAIVWYDVMKKRLSFIRNEERPLAMIESNNAYYFASEYCMLKWILTRNDVKIKTDLVAHLKANTLVHLDLNKTTIDNTDFTFVEIPATTITHASSRILPADNDEDDHASAIQIAWHKRSKSNLIANETFDKEIQESSSFVRNKSTTIIPHEKEFNIYYGQDRKIISEENDYQQIVWSIEDYKLLKTEENGNCIFMISGTPLNSKTMTCRAGVILKSVEEMEKLACESYVISFVKRVKKDWVWVPSLTHSNVTQRKDMTVIVVSGTMPIEMVEYSQSKILITKEHKAYLDKSPGCRCDPLATQGKKDEDGLAIYGTTDNQIDYQCAWCKDAEVALEQSGI